MHHRVALILAIAFLAMTCIHPEGVFGQSSKTGYGDFCVHLNGGTDVAHAGAMNTLEIYIANDAVLEGMTPAIEINFYCSFSWDMGYGSHPPVNEEGRAVGAWDNYTGLMIVQDFDDLSPEHIVFGGAAMPGGGLPDGPSDICYSLQFYIPDTEGPNPSGICVQPYFYPPAHTWTFADAGGGYPPDFCGQPVANPSDPVANPICFEIINQPPEIINCPTGTLYRNYCDVAIYDFEADDPEGDPYLFELVSGPGTIDQVSGVWTFAPDVGDLGGYTCEVRACDAYDCGPICTFTIVIINETPVFTGGCGVVLYAQPGQTVFNQLTADQPDCGPLVFSLTAADPPPSGPVTILPATGMFTFVPEIADTGTTVFTVRVDDEAGDYDECSFEVIVISGAVAINEVRSFDMSGPAGERFDAFIELYNADNTTISLGDYTIVAQDGSTLASLPSWSMPAGAYVSVTLGSGTDDSDFSDGVGSYFTQGDSIGVLDESIDEVGLYRLGTIVDFVGWSNTGSPSGGAPYSDALSNAIWTAGDYVDVTNIERFSTIGLCPSGIDNDMPSDWRFFDFTYFTTGLPRPANPIQRYPSHGSSITASENLYWASVSHAVEYLIEIDDDSTFGSPELAVSVADTFIVVPALTEGFYYWRVRVDDGSGLIDIYDVWEFYFDSGLKAPADILLDVPQVLQHKDTKLLCITHDFGVNPTCVRPGCDELATETHGPWDGAHAATHAHITRCDHCGNYCGRASIQMINFFYSSVDNLTQDHISYELNQANVHPGNPEGDLGHKRYAWIKPNEVGPALSWALNGHGTTAVIGILAWATITAECNAGHPIMILTPGHWMVLDGYRTRFGRQQVHIVDPWPAAGGGGGAQTGWINLANITFIGYYTLAAGTPGARAEISQVLTDADDDKIRDFDEGLPGYPNTRPRRFHAKFNEADSDSDEVGDKEEIKNYTFHDQPGYHPGHENDALTFPDIDGDGLRAEHDCDSDDDKQFDGGEDAVGDGHNPVNSSANETCQFMDTDYHIDVNVDKDVYALGEPVLIVDIPGSRETSTYHVNAFYRIEVGDGLPIKVDGDAINHTGMFVTDTFGCAVPSLVSNCYKAGIFYLYVDILSDGEYSYQDNWDPNCWWMCDSLPYEGWHPGVNLEHFNEEFEWPFVFPTVCPSGGEVMDIDIFALWWWYSEWPQPPRDYWLGISVPADLLAEETIWIDLPPSFVNQTDECSGTEIIPFASDAMIELDLNEQFGDEDTYWFGFAISNWQLPDSLMVTDVVITILPNATRVDEIPIQIRMGDSDYGWSPAYYRSIGIPSGPAYLCGDADNSGGVDIDDVVYLINYIFAGGPEPNPYESGDADCSGFVDIDDVVYLINYIFAGGPAPCDPDGDGEPDC